MEDYQRKFNVLICRCDDYTPKQQIYMFTVGLREQLKTGVELQMPANLRP